MISITERIILTHENTSSENRMLRYLQDLDENREEKLMDFLIKYLVRINNMSSKKPRVPINGRLINKIFLRIFRGLEIVIPIAEGSDPAYNQLFFSKLGELK